jgi:hypothetical protein
MKEKDRKKEGKNDKYGKEKDSERRNTRTEGIKHEREEYGKEE